MRYSLMVGAIVLTIACGGSPASSTGSPNGSPGAAANIAGTWDGTCTAALFGVDRVRLQLTQNGTAVTGSWADTGPATRSGTISGTTTANTFSGTFTLAGCAGAVGGFSGDAGGPAMNWVSTQGFVGNSPDCTIPGVTIAVQKQ